VKYRCGALDTFFEEGGFMARIPDIEIERLKNEISLERLVASAGIALERHGADLLGRCPFHENRKIGTDRDGPH
jgi:hypothetical protein